MVTTYGMSDRLGPQQLGKVKGEVFLGYDKGHEADYSPEVAGVVVDEVGQPQLDGSLHQIVRGRCAIEERKVRVEVKLGVGDESHGRSGS